MKVRKKLFSLLSFDVEHIKLLVSADDVNLLGDTIKKNTNFN
jgi:hypothetical protein